MGWATGEGWSRPGIRRLDLGRNVILTKVLGSMPLSSQFLCLPMQKLDELDSMPFPSKIVAPYQFLCSCDFPLQDR